MHIRCEFDVTLFGQVAAESESTRVAKVLFVRLKYSPIVGLRFSQNAARMDHGDWPAAVQVRRDGQA